MSKVVPSLSSTKEELISYIKHLEQELKNARLEITKLKSPEVKTIVPQTSSGPSWYDSDSDDTKPSKEISRPVVNKQSMSTLARTIDRNLQHNERLNKSNEKIASENLARIQANISSTTPSSKTSKIIKPSSILSTTETNTDIPVISPNLSLLLSSETPIKNNELEEAMLQDYSDESSDQLENLVLIIINYCTDHPSDIPLIAHSLMKCMVESPHINFLCDVLVKVFSDPDIMKTTLKTNFLTQAQDIFAVIIDYIDKYNPSYDESLPFISRSSYYFTVLGKLVNNYCIHYKVAGHILNHLLNKTPPNKVQIAMGLKLIQNIYMLIENHDFFDPFKQKWYDAISAFNYGPDKLPLELRRIYIEITKERRYFLANKKC